MLPQVSSRCLQALVPTAEEIISHGHGAEAAHTARTEIYLRHMLCKISTQISTIDGGTPTTRIPLLLQCSYTLRNRSVYLPGIRQEKV